VQPRPKPARSRRPRLGLEGTAFSGKVAVITGAAEGIGAGLVTGYRGRGWSGMASATILRPPNDPEVLAVEGDIADPAGTGRVIDAALERFGRLDTLVNNAGMVISKPFTDYTAADYADVVGACWSAELRSFQRSSMCSQPTLRRRSPGGTWPCPGSLPRRSMVLSTPPRLVAWTMTRR
jgi:NAD(P)-dependent dehydrogenase (short-subunit alcohol dehydrogenase family)